MLKLFQVSLVVFLTIVSLAFLVFLFTGIAAMFQPFLLAETNGIVAVSGGVSVKRAYFLILAAAFLIGGLYLFWRQRRVK